MGSHIALFSVTALQNFGTVTTSSLSTTQNNCPSLLIHCPVTLFSDLYALVIIFWKFNSFLLLRHDSGFV